MAQRTVLITGASGGLGRAVTGVFLADGWRVVAPQLPGSTTEPPAGAEVVAADLTDETAVAQAVTHAAGVSTAPLTAVVNLVGGFTMGARVHETPWDSVEAMLTVNLRPTYLVTAAALPHLMAGGGSVVCVSARAALQPFAGAVGYATAKAAVLAFANAVAVEYGSAGVRCNTVLPGTIDTPANRAAQPEADRSRWVSPELIAPVIRFLASHESAPTTGAAVPVYGTT